MTTDTKTISDELVMALEAADRACETIRDFFGRQVAREHKIVSSESQGLVTRADVEAEQLIINMIKNRFPDHNFLAEESGASSSIAGPLWVIDPLDGTNNFAHGIPHFSVSIAFCEDGETKCGVVANPVSGEICWAQQGGGAWLDDRQVAVGQETSLEETIAVTGFYYDRGEMMKATLNVIEELFNRNIRGVRRFGSAALDLCYVGLGRFGAYYEYRLSPWDFAAGKLFVEEAGGTVTTCAGDPVQLQPTSMLATNGHLHSQVLEITQPLDKPSFYS